ncbi:hypothetical protein [Nocardia sp. NPDC050710]|uniref:hypothetical protein n=1 Tax=Nocardia sp. NPDC050710 TaxID=3157220 RepID=UPI0034050C0C
MVAAYLSNAFDDPRAVELDRWTLTCFPTTNKSSTHQRLFTLNIGPMEVLYLAYELVDGQVVDWGLTVYVSRSALEAETGCQLVELDARNDLLSIRATSMASAEDDGAVITCWFGDEVAGEQFDSLPLDVTTIRPLVDRLAIKGPGPYPRYHNPWFAAHVLQHLGQE